MQSDNVSVSGPKEDENPELSGEEIYCHGSGSLQNTLLHASSVQLVSAVVVQPWG